MTILFDSLKKISEGREGKTAIVDSDGTNWSYGLLLRKIEEIIDLLRYDLRLSHVTRIGIAVEDSALSIAFIFATSALNLEIITLNPKLKSEQILRLLNEVKCDYLITNTNLNLSNAEIVGQFGDLTFINFGDEGSKYVSSNFNYGAETFIVTASSGSTGDPKPIALSQETKFRRMLQSASLYSLTESDVIINASPFFHSMGQRLTFLPLLLGGTLVLLPRFNADRWLESVKKNSVTFTICVSTHLHALTPHLLRAKSGDLPIRQIVSSSAALNLTSKNALFQSEVFLFNEQYGATEVATATNLNSGDFQKSPLSVGNACREAQIEIRTADGAKQEIYGTGEIHVRSSLAYEGYVFNGELKEFNKEIEFFPTGDLGKLDEFGFLYFLGRKKEVINVGGQNVYPLDVEKVMLECADVDECLVVPAPDEYFGEIPVALIVTRSEKNLVLSQIRNLAAVQLASFQQPMHYEFVDAIPKLPSGKVNRILLMEYAASLKLDIGSRYLRLQIDNQ